MTEITKRDWLAGLAMHALITRSTFKVDEVQASKQAILFADEMIKALESDNALHHPVRSRPKRKAEEIPEGTLLHSSHDTYF